MDNEISTQICGILADLWDEAKKESFVSYVRRVHKLRLHNRPRFRYLVIAEAEAGSLGTGPCGGRMKHWWKVDDSGIREEHCQFDCELQSSEAPYFSTPVIVFYREGDCVAIAERLGSNMMCWKRARIVRRDDGPVELAQVEQYSPV